MLDVVAVSVDDDDNDDDDDDDVVATLVELFISEILESAGMKIVFFKFFLKNKLLQNNNK